MKVSYRRELRHNYLIIDPEELVWRNFECRMLAGNAIDGVLHFELRQMDDEIRFYYEITSRQPLSRLLDGQMIRAEELRRLVLGISAILDRTEQYLLREGCILLEPDYMYVEPETFRVWLCLVPGLERDFPEDYGKLLKYLLGKVDHQDKESVVLAYGLYQETRKENYGMEDILRHLRPEGRRETREEEGEEPQLNRPEARSDSSLMKKPEVQSDHRSVEKADNPPGIWKRFWQWLTRKRESEDEDVVRVPLEMLFREEEYPEEQPRGPQKEQYMNLERQVHREVQPAERDTILLTDLSQSGGEALRCLRALDRGMEDIVIAYYPFIIGKQENLVDYLLMRDTVSRLHVRIDQDGDSWKIQDLNSTNGTMVGGKMLENNEAAEVHIGDEVRIAEFRYRFE